MNRNVYNAYCSVLSAWHGPLDGHCHEIALNILDITGKGTLVKYAIPKKYGHAPCHYCIKVNGVIYDPTIGHAEWSKSLGIKPTLYVVKTTSPHKKWRKIKAIA